MDRSDRDEKARERLREQQWPRTDRVADEHAEGEPDVDDEESPFPDVVGTRDATEAVEDAEPYVPAIDPPVVPGGEEGIQVATGFGTSVEEETSRASVPRGDEQIRDRVMVALGEDALTSDFAVDAEVNEGVVRLTGTVPSADDADHMTWLVGELAGVVDVIDDTRCNLSSA